MKNKKLHECAKFLSGVIFADFLYGLWLYTAGLLPLQWWGITFAGSMAVGAIHCPWMRRGIASQTKDSRTTIAKIFSIRLYYSAFLLLQATPQYTTYVY